MCLTNFRLRARLSNLGKEGKERELQMGSLLAQLVSEKEVQKVLIQIICHGECPKTVSTIKLNRKESEGAYTYPWDALEKCPCLYQTVSRDPRTHCCSEITICSLDHGQDVQNVLIRIIFACEC